MRGNGHVLLRCVTAGVVAAAAAAAAAAGFEVAELFRSPPFFLFISSFELGVSRGCWFYVPPYGAVLLLSCSYVQQCVAVHRPFYVGCILTVRSSPTRSSYTR